jgi:hypothetical protein
MLYEKELWKKYAGRDITKAEGWAPMPVPPVTKTIVPTAKDNDNVFWRYTTEKPADGWFKADFDAGSWKEGKAGFGTSGTPGAVVRTEWKTGNIWLRRELVMADDKINELQIIIHHDEDAEVYINGVPALTANGYTSDYETVPVNSNARNALKPGKNLVAIHCKQVKGGQYIDIGFADIVPAK